MSGYRPRHPGFYRLWNLLVSSFLLLLAAPLIAVIAVALACTQGPRNIFYCGPRLGQGSREFGIIKFMTLRREAAGLTKDRVLPENAALETPLGKYLRDTRLDELPQLINVVRGDMNMLGPRPVRASIAASCRASVPAYDTRFEVKPGLIGYTQALMPHGAEKAIRARVNSMLCHRPVNLAHEMSFISVTGLCVMLKTVALTRSALRDLLLGRPRNLLSGELPCQAKLALNDATSLQVISISRDSMQVECRAPLPPVGVPACVLRLQNQRSAKTAHCTASILSHEVMMREIRGVGMLTHRYRLAYQPASPLSRYLIDRYLREKVVVV
jgi:lipopolysaccharide/colanic/teichoic acid biosynthesis glycosyltransferase